MSVVGRVAAGLIFAVFLSTSFYRGWTRSETDFPNYYTAAVLVREGKPLRAYYDWTWFQREMNYAGIETQLGAYLPQTPLTMLPMVPLARFPVQRAKQIWLVLNLLFLTATVWMLSNVSGIGFEWASTLLLVGFGSLHSNFLLGQYYVFLLLVLTAAFYFLQRGGAMASGFLCGVAFGLKLYGAPFLFYFLAKRNWKAVAGMLVASAIGVGTAVALFGWADVHYYATQILPRSLEGEIIDPYNSGNGTLTTLLRSLFVRETELNPHPLWNLPVAFFFLRTFVTLGILALTLVGVSGKRGESEGRDFAWFTIAVLLISSNAAPYTYILLLLPVVLLLKDASRNENVFLIMSYVLLNALLPDAWVPYFPKLWILAALYVLEGRERWRVVPWRWATAGVAVLVLIAAVDARKHEWNHRLETGQRFERVPLDRGTYLSMYPVTTEFGIFYEAMMGTGYVIRWIHDGRAEELRYGSEAFHPVKSADGAIEFEVVRNGTSRMMRFDASTRGLREIGVGDPASGEAVSPDGHWVAFEVVEGGGTQILVRNVKTSEVRELTGGRCNNSSAAWERDSRGLIFASDCGRGLGLAVLYRARVW
jgi:hypothetical protein